MAVQLNMKKDLKKSTIGAAAVVYHFNQRFVLRKTYLPIHVRLYMNPQGTHRSAGGFLVKSLYLFLFLSGYAWQSRTVKTQHFLFKRLTHAFAGNHLYFVSQRRTHRASIPESAFLSIFLPVFFLLPFLLFSAPVAHAATLGKPANNLGLTG